MYEFIKAHRGRYAVEPMCRVLGDAPSGYYEWLQQPLSNRAQEDARLLRLIRASFTASHGIYGAPRVFLDLREAGEVCSKHRVARQMREAIGPDPESPATTIHHDAAQQGLGHRHHLHPHVARLALPSRRYGSVLAHDRGVGCRPTIHRELVLNAVLMAVRLKKERIKKHIHKNRELAIADVADYVDTFYNHARRHSHLGGLSPAQFEAAHKPRRQSLH
jgi:putative transposase